MSVLILLASLALAGGPIAVVVPSEAAPDTKDLEKYLQDALVRSNLKLVDETKLAHPKAMTTALLAHPGECGASLNEAQLAEVGALEEGADEVYLVLPTSDKSKDAMVWRYDASKKVLLKVGSKKLKSPELAPAKAPGKLVLLVWKDERQSTATVEDLQKWLGAETVEVVQDSAVLIDGLMKFPSECEPETNEAMIAQLEALAEGVEDPLLIAVKPPTESSPMLWRWDAGAKRMHKIATP